MKISRFPRWTSGARRRRGEVGFSLLETLIAAAILAVVAVGLLPIFHRSVWNNISGADASLVTQMVKSEQEELKSLPYDAPSINMSLLDPMDPSLRDIAGGGQEMVLSTTVWDPAANAPVVSGYSQTLANGAWVTDPATAQGLVVWQRETVVRQYSYADISDGVIDVTTGNTLTTQGHPHLFDTPLRADAPKSQVNFVEQDVSITSMRPGIRGLRVHFLRTY